MKMNYYLFFIYIFLTATFSEAVTDLDTVKTYYSDGTLSRIYTTLKGTALREGVSISYHPNAKVAVEAVYKAGKLDGVFKSYYENGNLMQTTGYKNDLEEGISMSYQESGIRKLKEVYREGVLHGTSSEFDEKGVLRRELPYLEGHIHGKAKIYDSLGSLIEDMDFVNGVRDGFFRRYNRGLIVHESEFRLNRCVKNCQ